MSYNDFHYGLSLCQTLFGIELSEDDYEEMALVGWNLIGNKRIKLYRYHTEINDCQKGVLLPCNVDEIEAVTTDFEEWDYSTNDTPNGNFTSAVVEQYIESRKAFRDPMYLPGKFIKYERVGDMLFFDRPHGHINILYKGYVLDDSGLPLITDEEALALATYCAYVTKFKEGLMTNNANIILLANTLKLLWDLRCDLARVGHYMSLNEFDQILDAKTSWNRKIHGKSLKVYR